MNKDIENYELNRRLGEIPNSVLKVIRREFNDLKGGTTLRWHRITKDKEFSDLRIREYLLLKKHIGCEAEELIDPTVSLLSIYMERKYSIKDQELAAQYGLAKGPKLS